MKQLPDSALTAVQFEILEAAWNGAAGASVAEIWETVSAKCFVTRTTILNLVDRLAKRGWLARQKTDGVYRYRPTVDRETATGKVAAEFVDAFFSGSARAGNEPGRFQTHLAVRNRATAGTSRPAQPRLPCQRIRKMTSIPSDLLSVPVLLYLANVAIASVLVCGGGLIIERLCRRRSLPFRHALLLTALVAALATPLVIGAALATGRSPFRISLAGLAEPAGSMPAEVANPGGELPAASDLPPTRVALVRQDSRRPST